MGNIEPCHGFVAPKVAAELPLFFITTPADGRYHVCRMVPGKPAIDVGSYTTRDEAEEVLRQLNFANYDKAVENHPIPPEMNDLICRL